VQLGVALPREGQDGAVSHFISRAREGVTCAFHVGHRDTQRADLCGSPATHKVGEEILHDDPNPVRHNLTAYVCCFHFSRIVGRVCS
jgi:hypothetical protein